MGESVEYSKFGELEREISTQMRQSTPIKITNDVRVYQNVKWWSFREIGYAVRVQGRGKLGIGIDFLLNGKVWLNFLGLGLENEKYIGIRITKLHQYWEFLYFPH